MGTTSTSKEHYTTKVKGLSPGKNGDGRLGWPAEGSTDIPGPIPGDSPFAMPCDPPGRGDGDGPWGGGGVGTSLLVSKAKSVSKLGSWAGLSEEEKARISQARRRRRCYHRVMSGLEVGGEFRIMMLSSGMADRDRVQHAWRGLVQWANRRGLLAGYIRVPELTEQGFVHLHVVFRGRFIDRLALMREWYRLVGGPEYMPGAKYVYLQGVRSKRGIAHYMAKYMAKGAFERAGNYSWSWSWVWRGFVASWRGLLKAWRGANRRGWDLGFGVVLSQWRWHLQAGIPP